MEGISKREEKKRIEADERMKKIKEESTRNPVVGSGEYVCEADGCEVIQNDDAPDTLFYASDDRIFCAKHVQA